MIYTTTLFVVLETTLWGIENNMNKLIYAKKIRRAEVSKDLVKTNGNGGIDLYATDYYKLKKGDFALIDLGITVKLPQGCHAFLMPRSSTYKKWGIIQANSIGLVDNSYCGPDDVWKMPVIAMRDTEILPGDKIAQMVVFRAENPFFDIMEVSESEFEFMENRGGFGSTGSK